jgi:hypothetical protein
MPFFGSLFIFRDEQVRTERVLYNRWKKGGHTMSLRTETSSIVQIHSITSL